MNMSCFQHLRTIFLEIAKNHFIQNVVRWPIHSNLFYHLFFPDQNISYEGTLPLSVSVGCNNVFILIINEL